MLKYLCVLAVGLIGFPAAAEEPISPFARNVITHVFVHELAHALIREFDLPVLGNEEVMADSFATLYIARTMPTSANEIIRDRALSWMTEAAQNDPDQDNPLSEYPSDTRRAYWAICLLYGNNPSQFGELPKWGDFPRKRLRGCADFAPEIARSWRRMLAKYEMPEGVSSREYHIIVSDGPLRDDIEASGLVEEFEQIIRSFDWHSMITVNFDHCKGSATWIRNGRTIRICDTYILRFIEQDIALRYPTVCLKREKND